MNKIVDLSEVLSHKIDTPKTGYLVSTMVYARQSLGLPSVAVACREAHEAVGKVVGIDEGAESAAKIW